MTRPRTKTVGPHVAPALPIAEASILGLTINIIKSQNVTADAKLPVVVVRHSLASMMLESGTHTTSVDLWRWFRKGKRARVWSKLTRQCIL